MKGALRERRCYRPATPRPGTRPETRHTIVRFYASNVGEKDWEEDILGQDVLRPGQSVTVNVDDGSGYCLYDFKAVFDDGDELVRSRIDVCEVSSYRYTED